MVVEPVPSVVVTFSVITVTSVECVTVVDSPGVSFVVTVVTVTVMLVISGVVDSSVVSVKVTLDVELVALVDVVRVGLGA